MNFISDQGSVFVICQSASKGFRFPVGLITLVLCPLYQIDLASSSYWTLLKPTWRIDVFWPNFFKCLFQDRSAKSKLRSNRGVKCGEEDYDCYVFCWTNFDVVWNLPFVIDFQRQIIFWIRNFVGSDLLVTRNQALSWQDQRQGICKWISLAVFCVRC